MLHLSVCASMDITNGWGFKHKQRRLCLHTNATNTQKTRVHNNAKHTIYFADMTTFMFGTKKPSKLIKRSVVSICPCCDLLKKLWCLCNSSTTLSLPYGTVWHRKVESMKQKIRKREEEILKRAKKKEETWQSCLLVAIVSSNSPVTFSPLITLQYVLKVSGRSLIYLCNNSVLCLTVKYLEFCSLVLFTAQRGQIVLMLLKALVVLK